MSHALDAIFAELNANRLFHIDIGPVDPSWHRLDEALQSDWLAQKYQRFATDYPGLDQRGQGAFAVGRVSYIFATILAACDLSLGQVPPLTSTNLWLREEDEQLRLRLTSVDLAAVSSATLREMLINLMSAFIGPVKTTSRLNAAAQWRLISDSVAVAWQMVGRTLNNEAEAEARAMDILAAEPSPLRNKQTGFTRVSVWVPGKDQAPVQVEQSYRIRGGCCRLYTADDRDYCATCVLLKPEEQQQRLQQSLRQSLSA
ncbi:(2Fe-2S)-binding protein [Reinekea blandensis]|uniref:Ferric siderophore reductase C-terminal domain-containing protein n=1 Tax=Reinekea blandensis MED297 TaxID=314283 RepID=A4BJ31_9GAMM|nr:(2Fe-2S)-binding protein [Reinekea blandensis]EAR07876.1 hypothetical protein MED297_08651 [Reinekea sp. MED297] [Reinekea blandensis MED297]